MRTVIAKTLHSNWHCWSPLLSEFDGKAENPAKFRVFQVFHSTCRNQDAKGRRAFLYVTLLQIRSGISRIDQRGNNSSGRDRFVQQAEALGFLKAFIFNARSAPEFENLFAAMTEQNAGALLVAADPYFNSQRGRLVALAAQHQLPAIYEWRQCIRRDIEGVRLTFDGFESGRNILGSSDFQRHNFSSERAPA